MPQTLHQLLRAIDAAAAPPQASRDLARAIRRRHAQQRLTRRLALAAVLLVSLSLLALWTRPRQVISIATAPPAPAPPASSESLQLTAQLHEMTADLLLASRPRRAVH